MSYLPTLEELLATEVFAEAQILTGAEVLGKNVCEVVLEFGPGLKPDSLLVTNIETINWNNQAYLSSLAGIVLVGQAGHDQPAANVNLTGAALSSAVQIASAWQVGFDAAVLRLENQCQQAGIALIAIAGLGEPIYVAEEIRLAHLRQVKLNGMRLHAHLLQVVLKAGLAGLVEEVSLKTNRPWLIETVNFQILAARNMSATPISQQQNVSEQIALMLKRKPAKEEGSNQTPDFYQPIKIGRRLLLPICLDTSLIGHICVMTKANDNLEMLSDYLQTAASVATVDFYQRGKDGSIFTVTQKSLLKDLLAGRSLSAADQERMERHYGFDLCDGLLVFAVNTTSGDFVKSGFSPEENMATIDMEGTQIFVLPYNLKDGKTWQKIAENLVIHIKQFLERQGDKTTTKIQLGAGRLAENILGLADAYREARQALIIGSMINGQKQFMLGYGDSGVKRLLYLMIDHPELERFYEENLAPLESYDVEWESELVPSLRVYLTQGANLNSAARALFVHRHTLRYRLEQIAEILKVNIDSQETLLNLQIAFLIKDMKHGNQT